MSEWAVANRIEQVNGESGGIQVVDEVTLAANGVGETTFRVKETDVLWCASVAVTSVAFNFAHRLEFKTENRFLDNDYVRSENFWGTAQLPMRHAPKFLPINAELTFSFIETSNVGGVVALYLWTKRADVCGPQGKHGFCKNPNCRCDRARWGQGRGLFVLSTAGPTTAGSFAQGGITVASGGLASVGVKTPDTYHYRAHILNGSAFNGAAGATANSAWKGNIDRMDPRDERRGYVSSSQSKQVRAAGLVGTGTAPGRLPSPLLNHKGGQFGIDVTDLGGATTNHVHLTLIGETIDDDQIREND